MIPRPVRGPSGRFERQFELLLWCAREAADPFDDGRAGGGQGPLDWEDVIHTAEWHGLVPLLQKRLLGAPSLGAPSDVAARLGQSDLANRLRNRLLTAELLRLRELFNGRGIRSIAYKGPLLAATAYGDVGLRAFNDLDVLVRESHLGAAIALLEAEGYSERDPGLTRARRAALVWSESHSEFLSPDGVVRVDLHWRLFPRRLPFRVDLEHLWSTAVSRPLDGQVVEGFPPEEELLVLCIHATKDLWRKLAWVVDVDRVARAHPGMDWSAVQQLAVNCRAGRALRLGLFLAHDLLATPLPPAVTASIGEDDDAPRLAATVYADLQGGTPNEGLVSECLDMAGLHFEVCEGAADRARYVFLTLTAPDRWDWGRFPLPDPLFALFYALRPLRLGARCVREVARRVVRAVWPERLRP